MNRKSPTTPVEAPSSRATPSEEHAALALRESAVLLAPVARWLLRNGVSYGAIADQLKSVFIDAARSELSHAGTKPTFSALSMLSGVHRKDVRAIETEAQERAAPTQRGIPLASQVYTRWVTARRYRTRDGQPRTLPRSGHGITFEELAREVSQDVHPRTVLDELLRLGQVRLDGEQVIPLNVAFTPTQQLGESTSLFAANAGDHIAAAVQNLSSETPPFLEHSVFADGLSAESVALLQKQAVTSWLKVFEAMVASATERVEGDAALPPATHQRMRFGTYFYSEPQHPADTVDDAPPAGRAARPASAPRPRRKK
ncbi:MAG: DUF6502 family protein [Burkholderiales bacterium]